MQHDNDLHRLFAGFGQILVHALITLLAVVIAFSLPALADGIQAMWPRLQSDPEMMLAAEIGLASVLVLLFNLAKIAWDNRSRVTSARLAALVYARNGDGLLSRWKERSLVKRLPAARDAFILTLTGFDTLVDKASSLRAVLQSTYEIRVMLLNPLGEVLPRRATSFPDHEVSAQSLASEIGASIASLAALRNLGKKVTLKFYDVDPLWKLVFLGDHVWVQHVHCGRPVRSQPEYVFGFLHHDPRRGFYVPFLSHFLDLWSRPGQPEFDFESHELVFRDAAGAEERRLPFRPAAA
jgi:hypothetical protein